MRESGGVSVGRDARQTKPYLRPLHDARTERYPRCRIPYLVRTQHSASFEASGQPDQSKACRDQAVSPARILVRIFHASGFLCCDSSPSSQANTSL